MRLPGWEITPKLRPVRNWLIDLVTWLHPCLNLSNHCCNFGKKNMTVSDDRPAAENTPENKSLVTSRVKQTVSSQPATPVSLICWRASARRALQGNSLFLSLWTSAALCQLDPLTWNNPLSTPRSSTAPTPPLCFPSSLPAPPPPP